MIGGLDTYCYRKLNEHVPDTLPGEWPFIIQLFIKNPTPWYPGWNWNLATDFYIVKIAIDEVDGEW